MSDPSIDDGSSSTGGVNVESDPNQLNLDGVDMSSTSVHADRNSSRSASRPSSGLTSSRTNQLSSHTPTEPSEASRAAAIEAQAAVHKDGTLPAPPAGLLSFAATIAANTGLNDTLLGMGPAPVMTDVPLVTVPRLDDLIIKALADNYHGRRKEKRRRANAHCITTIQQLFKLIHLL